MEYEELTDEDILEIKAAYREYTQRCEMIEDDTLWRLVIKLNANEDEIREHFCD